MDVFLTGFPKKLLVAISLVVIVAMCLRPAEAAPSEHKRHRQHEAKTHMARLTKDTAARLEGVPNKRRHQRHRPKCHNAKAMRNMTLGDLIIEDARTKIKNQVSLIKRNLKDGRKKLEENVFTIFNSEDGTGMLKWVPKTNFVEIHFTNDNITLLNGYKSKKSFVFLIHKLYKSLVAYYERFERFLQLKFESPDAQMEKYLIERQKFFTTTTNDLNSTIRDIEDRYSNISNGALIKDQVKTNSMQIVDIKEMSVNTMMYLKYDRILLRSYSNLLHNWHMELNCSKFCDNEKVKESNCTKYVKRLKLKLKKKQKQKKTKAHAPIKLPVSI